MQPIGLPYRIWEMIYGGEPYSDIYWEPSYMAVIYDRGFAISNSTKVLGVRCVGGGGGKFIQNHVCIAYPTSSIEAS